MTENKTGQSTLEYIILLGSVVLFLALFFGKDGFFQNQMNAAYYETVDSVGTMTQRLTSSYDKQGGGSTGGGDTDPVTPPREED